MGNKIKFNEVTKIKSIKEMLELAVKEDGDKLAFRYREEDKIVDVTYKEFQNDTLALGTALLDKGFTKNHIAVIGDNSYNWITVYLTVLKSSSVIVPIDKELPIEDVVNVVNDSDSEVLFYDAKHEKGIMEYADKMPNIKYFIGFSRDADDGKFLSYHKFKEAGRKLYKDGNKKYNDQGSDEYELKMLVYTSGTTGMAKGVMLTEHNLVSCIYYGLQTASILTRCLSVLPYHHTYEAVAGLLVALHKRVTICINESIKSVSKNLQLYKPDYVYLVPAFAEVFYKKIWSNAEKSGKDKALKIMIPISNALRKVGIDLRRKLFKSVHAAFGGELREIVCGGAPLRPELASFFDSIGITLLNGYGITECSPLVSVNQMNFNDPETVGVILPCCEVKIENPTDDGDGEILVKGDIVMKGYYKRPDLTEEVLKDGWFNTGDYGKINEKGQLMITGRKKNLIVLENGKNVFPEELELYISSISYVADVVVYGVKNESGAEVGLCAEVFANEERVAELNIEDVEATLKKDISKVCEKLPIYKRITQVVLRKEPFEKTTTNKIKRATVGK